MKDEIYLVMTQAFKKTQDTAFLKAFKYIYPSYGF